MFKMIYDLKRLLNLRWLFDHRCYILILVSMSRTETLRVDWCVGLRGARLNSWRPELSAQSCEALKQCAVYHHLGAQMIHSASQVLHLLALVWSFNQNKGWWAWITFEIQCRVSDEYEDAPNFRIVEFLKVKWCYQGGQLQKWQLLSIQEKGSSRFASCSWPDTAYFLLLGVVGDLVIITSQVLQPSKSTTIRRNPKLTWILGWNRESWDSPLEYCRNYTKYYLPPMKVLRRICIA